MHRCNICDQSDSKVMIDGPGTWHCYDPVIGKPFPFQVAVCQHCGHVFGVWDRDRTEQYVEEEYVTCDSDLEQYTAYVQFVLAGLPPMNRPPRILEIGFNRGSLLKRFHDLGFDCYGVEPGRQNVEAARARMPRAKLDQGMFDAEWAARFDDGYFDVVILTSVFEHIPDPVGVLRSARTCLAHDGRLFLIVPDLASYTPTIQIKREHEAMYGCSQVKFFYRNLFLCYAQHVNHFSAASLTRYLAAFGFQTQQIATIGYIWVSAAPAEPVNPSLDCPDLVEYHTQMMTHYEELLDGMRQTVVNQLAGKRVVCYGAGREFGYFLDTFAPLGVEVLAVADDDPSQSTVHGVPCVKPGELASYDPDVCLATGFDYENEIAEKATALLPDTVEVATLTQLISAHTVTIPRWTTIEPVPSPGYGARRAPVLTS
jgi:2-polyprenyl-3-methyl-5-hydroxy-6-metoxy-1,4-benzoquinol methylase